MKLRRTLLNLGLRIWKGQSPVAWWTFGGLSMSVAGSDCGDGSSINGGVELGHGGFGEVAR
jgi:hypothetical protein